MGKLVRDRIPEIIRADGKTPIIRIMDDEEYVKELDRKLCEEVEEYRADRSIEEMADILDGSRRAILLDMVHLALYMDTHQVVKNILLEVA